jgi:hypothetical protein
MIFLCPAQDGSIALTAPTIRAFSEAAESVDRVIEEGLRHLAKPRMELLVSEIEQVVEEAASEAGEGFAPVDIETASAALQFAYSLPWSLPTPEVAPDPDGDISFDWLGPSGKMFSVSVNKAGRVAYAGRFSDKSKIHGIEQLSTACPQEIIRGVARAIA